LHIFTLINLHIFSRSSAFAAGDPCYPCSIKIFEWEPRVSVKKKNSGSWLIFYKSS